MGFLRRVGHNKKVYKKRYSINRHRVGWLAKQGLNHYYANKDCKFTLKISMKLKIQRETQADWLRAAL